MEYLVSSVERQAKMALLFTLLYTDLVREQPKSRLS